MKPKALLFLLAACLLAALCATAARTAHAGAVRTTAPNRAATCPTGTFTSGYKHANNGWDDGFDANLTVSDSSDYVVGNVRDKLTVVNSSGDGLTVGLADFGNGPEVYFEDNGSFKGQWSAGFNTTYQLALEKVSAGNWDAFITAIGNDHQYTTSTFSGATEMDYFLTSNDSIGGCNQAYFSNSSAYPWTTSQMTKIQASPYLVCNITSMGWDVDGPVTSCP